MLRDFTVFNIRDYLSSGDDDLGAELNELLSEFSCSENPKDKEK